MSGIGRIELVVFDLAGTTVDDRGGVVNAALWAAIAAAGLEVDPSAIDAVMGLPKPVAIGRLVAGTPLVERIDPIHDDFVARMIDHYRNAEGVVEVEGASAAFARLRGAGVRVGVDTGFSRPIVRAIFDRLGWSEPGTIDASATSDEVARGRPYPDMIYHLMQRLDVTDPARVAKAGDAPADLEEGTAAGCGRVIGVTWGTHGREALARFPHTDLVDSFADLLRAVGVDAR